MTDNGLDLREIDPKKSTKYSPNIYRWLTMRNKKYRAKTSRVYRGEDGEIFVGMIDDGLLIGSRLSAVLFYGPKAQSFCFIGPGRIEEVADFWQRYIADGRCAIDTEHRRHFIGDESRWLQDGDTRSCQWCGKAHQVLKRWTETVDCSKWVKLEPGSTP